jgi:hypothetical protein
MLVEVFQLRNRITHGVTKIILKETELIEVNGTEQSIKQNFTKHIH